MLAMLAMLAFSKKTTTLANCTSLNLNKMIIMITINSHYPSSRNLKSKSAPACDDRLAEQEVEL